MNRVLLLVAIAAILSGCVTEDRPSTCGEPAASLELTLSATTLTPDDPGVCRDQEVTMVVASEVDGVLHIHGYDEAVPATSVAAGESITLSFTANRSGQFPVELHPAGGSEGVDVGVFTVYEP